LLHLEQSQKRSFSRQAIKTRIRLRFKEAIALIRTTWPELRAEAKATGLWIAPPKHGVQFVPQLERPKHIKEAEAKEEAERKRRNAEDMLKGLFGPGKTPGDRLFR
jgi:hypothetical protein